MSLVNFFQAGGGQCDSSSIYKSTPTTWYPPGLYVSRHSHGEPHGNMSVPRVDGLQLREPDEGLVLLLDARVIPFYTWRQFSSLLKRYCRSADLEMPCYPQSLIVQSDIDNFTSFLKQITSAIEEQFQVSHVMKKYLELLFDDYEKTLHMNEASYNYQLGHPSPTDHFIPWYGIERWLAYGFFVMLPLQDAQEEYLLSEEVDAEFREHRDELIPEIINVRGWVLSTFTHALFVSKYVHVDL